MTVLLISCDLTSEYNFYHLIFLGFMRRQKWLDSMGYPRPPPLMLERKLAFVQMIHSLRILVAVVALIETFMVVSFASEWTFASYI